MAATSARLGEAGGLDVVPSLAGARDGATAQPGQNPDDANVHVRLATGRYVVGELPEPLLAPDPGELLRSKTGSGARPCGGQAQDVGHRRGRERHQRVAEVERDSPQAVDHLTALAGQMSRNAQ